MIKQYFILLVDFSRLTKYIISVFLFLIYLSDLIIQFRNAYYLRNDIELLSYMYRLYEKYVDLGFKYKYIREVIQ